MPHEFVGKPQPAGVQDTIAADYDRVVERPPRARPAAFSRGRIIEQAEGARRRELGVERLRIDAQREVLVPDQRIVEVDLGNSSKIRNPAAGRPTIARHDLDQPQRS